MGGVARVRVTRRRPPVRMLAPAALLALIVAAPARADDATQWLARVAQAARQHNYIGTIVYQRGNRASIEARDEALRAIATTPRSADGVERHGIAVDLDSESLAARR